MAGGNAAGDLAAAAAPYEPQNYQVCCCCGFELQIQADQNSDETSKRSYCHKTAAFYVERTSTPVFYFIFSFQIMFDVIWKFENNNNNKTYFYQK